MCGLLIYPISISFFCVLQELLSPFQSNPHICEFCKRVVLEKQSYFRPAHDKFLLSLSYSFIAILITTEGYNRRC